MTTYLGIDGGGSNLRAVLVDDEMRVLAEAHRGSANPSSIGREAAAALIQSAVREALDRAALRPDEVCGVGIGIAGASAAYAADWLREALAPALPGVPVAPSSDNEIALVGAHGKAEGLLLLAGTGSVAFGIDSGGRKVQVGGWGYLLGDEGSGYWIGLEALRTLVREADGSEPRASSLTPRVLAACELAQAQDVIGWMYHAGGSRVRDVARLAEMVLQEADAGDWRAREIVGGAADALALLAGTAARRLDFPPLPDVPLCFAGGLLTHDNALSQAICARLGLDAIPTALYPPVIGAALLAKIRCGG